MTHSANNSLSSLDGHLQGNWCIRNRAGSFQGVFNVLRGLPSDINWQQGKNCYNIIDFYLELNSTVTLSKCIATVPLFFLQLNPEAWSNLPLRVHCILSNLVRTFILVFFFKILQYHTICKQSHTQRIICLKAYFGEDRSKEMTGMMMTACLEVEDQQIVLTYFYFSFVSPSDVLMDSFPPKLLQMSGGRRTTM